MSFKVGEKVIVETYNDSEEVTVVETDSGGNPTKFQDKNGTFLGLSDIFYFFKKNA